MRLPLRLLHLGFPAALVLSVACSSGTARPAVAPAAPAAQPPVGSSTPAPTPGSRGLVLPDQVAAAPTLDRAGDCTAIRGTTYLSEFERLWYLANCQGTGTAGSTAATPSRGPASSCDVLAVVSSPSPPAGSSVTVMARLSCQPTADTGLSFSADFQARSYKANCRGVSDAANEASCTVSTAGAARGTPVKVNACFSYNLRFYCEPLTFTPR